MALMLGALHRALIGAGASEDDARKAAEEVAGYERELAAVKADLTLLKWMVGTTIVLNLIILGKLILI